MSSESDAAFIALYGTNAEEITDELTEHQIGAINEKLHMIFDDFDGVSVESVALRTDM